MTDNPVPRPRGADLAREILARAKEDARRKAGRRRPAGGARHPGGTGTEADASAPATEDERSPTRRPRLPGMASFGRDWRQPVSFAAAVRRLVDERGWSTQATNASVLARWDALVGPEISARCQPVSLRDGELVIVAESTAWATQLRLLSGQILGRLRRELGPDVVRVLVIRGPTSPTSWNHGPFRAHGSRGPRDTYG